MKTLKKTRFILAAIAVMTLISAKTFAAVDAFIWFEDAKGTITKVKVNSDGTFKSWGLIVGTYSMSFHISRQQVAGSADRESSAPSVSEITVTCDINPHRPGTPPRDTQLVMATGKRMHKPFIITKELDKFIQPSTLSVALNKIVVDVDNDGLTGKVSFKDKKGNDVAFAAALGSN